MTQTNHGRVAKPLCAVCHRHPREPMSARCHNCGPGRIKTPKPPAGPPVPPDNRSDRCKQHNRGQHAPQDGVRN
jgi:hypothetical protein